jgi:hypothetical protein
MGDTCLQHRLLALIAATVVEPVPEMWAWYTLQQAWNFGKEPINIAQ